MQEKVWGDSKKLHHSLIANAIKPNSKWFRWKQNLLTSIAENLRIGKGFRQGLIKVQTTLPCPRFFLSISCLSFLLVAPFFSQSHAAWGQDNRHSSSPTSVLIQAQSERSWIYFPNNTINFWNQVSLALIGLTLVLCPIPEPIIMDREVEGAMIWPGSHALALEPRREPASSELHTLKGASTSPDENQG